MNITGIHLPEKYRDFYNEILEEELSHYRQPRETIDILYLLKGLCGLWSKKFQEKYPELKIQRGFYSGREHWWCVEPDGTIVDPTFLQFGQIPDSKKYKVLNPDTDEIQLGRCLNCGEYIYGLEKEGPQDLCKDVIVDGEVIQSCRKEFEHYLNNGDF